MSEGSRRLAGAVAGSLVAGAAITATIVSGERQSGKPSELADLGRATVRRVGIRAPDAATLPSASEQVAIQGAHLALAALAGVAYAAIFDRREAVLPSGIGFGLAFYAIAHWLAGPLLGLKAPEWQSGSKGIATHALNHAGFGIATALGARIAGGRRGAGR